jgi:hypothetical protein
MVMIHGSGNADLHSLQLGRSDAHTAGARSAPASDAGLDWVFAAGAIYEGQGHHAEFTLGWGHTEAVLYTHNVNRLTQADVVLAAKFNKVCSGAG